MRGLGAIPTGSNILSLDFLFSHSKASDANTGREQLIRSHSLARFYFELSGNSN